MQTLVTRKIADKLTKHMDNFPCVVLLGARQVGKSTLAKSYVKNRPNSIYLDLEDPVDLAKLTEPSSFLAANSDKLICLDEIQRYPEIFQIFRSYLDKGNRNGQLLLLGSASRDLIRQSSETLAGRVSYLEISPFLANEITDINKLWVQGGYPDSYLKDEEFSFEWRKNYIRTFLERDIPNLGIRIPAVTLRRFWQMLAHSNGQLLNYAKLASAMGVAAGTIKNYIDILEGTFVIYQLRPFHTNTKKRLIKSSKVYIRDTGLLHNLLGIESMNDLLGHPTLGNSFESMVINSIKENCSRYNLSFYRTASGSEIDLVLEKGLEKICIEIKASMAPKMTQGFYEAIKVIRPDKVFVVAQVEDSYPIGDGVMVVNLKGLLDELS
jgi:predicted AAA+ superfamily ATPase